MDTARLKSLIAASISRGEVTLASGAKSDFYVDGRLVTLTGEGSRLVGEAILELAREWDVTAIGGPTTGACPMVTAAGLLAEQAGHPLKVFYVRSAAKDYGMQKAIEGPALSKDDRVLIVDDVMTSGGSLIKAADRLREEVGCAIAGVYVIVDRLAGGAEKLAEHDLRLHAQFTRQDLD